MSSPQKAHEAIDAALTGNGSLAAAHVAVDEALEEVMAAGAGKGFQDAVIAARHSLFCEKHPASKQLPAVPVDCQVCKHVAALEGELAEARAAADRLAEKGEALVEAVRRSMGGGHAQNCRCHPHDGLTFICQGAKQNDSLNHPHPYTDPRCKPAPGENPEDGTSEHDHKPAPIPTRNEIINRWSLLWDFNLTTMENWKACADAVLKLMGER